MGELEKDIKELYAKLDIETEEKRKKFIDLAKLCQNTEWGFTAFADSENIETAESTEIMEDAELG